MGKEKDFQLLLLLAVEQFFQSQSFKLSLFYSESAQGMSGECELIIHSCLWMRLSVSGADIL